MAGNNDILLKTVGSADAAILALQAAVAPGIVPPTRQINTTAPLTGGGDLSANRTLAIPAATALADGYMTAAQATLVAGAVQGSATPGGDLAGAGSTYTTPLLTAIVAAGTKGSASKVAIVTIDAKGRVTVLAETDIAITESQVTNLVTDLAARVLKAGDTMSGNLILGSGASLSLTGGASAGQGNVQLGAAASALYDSNLLYVDAQTRTMGMVCSSTPAFGATNGPYFALRGVTYSALANQRGNLIIAAGSPSAPAASEGQITLRTGASDTVRIMITKDGLVGIGPSTPTAPLHVTGSFVGVAGDASLVRFGNSFTAQTGGDAYGVKIDQTFVTAGSGTHTYFLGMNIQPPTITAAGAAVTNAATVFIGNAPSVGSNKYALWSFSGLNRLVGGIEDGTLTANRQVYATTSGRLTTTPQDAPVVQTLVTKVFADSPVTVATTFVTILCDATGGNMTVNLPAAASNTGRILRVKKIDSSANTVTVDGNAAETIDGATTQVITVQYAWLVIQCDGSNWHIVG